MGGAKNCPETPRQRMISMMYLVLTAMLALNVSADILNGFTKLRHSMESSMRATTGRTDDVMKAFIVEAQDDKKYEDWLVIAKAVKEKSDEFYNYIESFKLDIANMCDNKQYQPGELDTVRLAKGDDTNKPHQYAEEIGETGKAHSLEMKERMIEFRTYMTSADSECVREKLMRDKTFESEWERKRMMYQNFFSTDDVMDEEHNIRTWEQSTFNEMPADAVIALLTKYQNDIRVSENDLINFLFIQAGSSDFVVNKVEAVVIPDAEYIMQGKPYRARIVSAMMDSTQQPRVFIGGEEIEGGVYVTSGHIGENHYSGYMMIGEDTTKYPFEKTFTVGAPAATIANEECNVLYQGYANKMAVSVPGVGADALTVTANGATVAKASNGHWTITPSGSAPVTISVSARMDGVTSSMGSQTFQVKKLPKPIAYIAVNGKIWPSSQAIPAAALPACKIIADNQDAVIKVDWTISGYKARCRRQTFNSIAQAASVAKPGDVIKIYDVRATNGGNTATLNDLSIEVQ